MRTREKGRGMGGESGNEGEREKKVDKLEVEQPIESYMYVHTLQKSHREYIHVYVPTCNNVHVYLYNVIYYVYKLVHVMDLS